MASTVFRCSAGAATTTAAFSFKPAAAPALRRMSSSLSIMRACDAVVAVYAPLRPTTLLLNSRLLPARIPSSRSLTVTGGGIASVATAAGVVAGATAIPFRATAEASAELTCAAECSTATLEAAPVCNIGSNRRYENMLLAFSPPRRETWRFFSRTAAGARPPQQMSEKKGGEESSSSPSSPTLEGRYAGALLRAAKQQNQLQAVYEEMVNMKELLQKSEDFKRFIETPALSNSQKEAFLQQLGTTFKLQQVTVNLLQVLLENRRMALLGRVADAFESLYRKEKGEIRCLVTSAQPLNPQQQKEVLAALQKRAGPRVQLMLDYAVNPQLMGGLVVRLGDQLLDFSVATRIDRLQAQLMAPL